MMASIPEFKEVAKADVIVSLKKNLIHLELKPERRCRDHPIDKKKNPDHNHLISVRVRTVD